MGLSFPVENPSQHIPLPCVVWSAALGQGHSDGPHRVSQHPGGRVDPISSSITNFPNLCPSEWLQSKGQKGHRCSRTSYSAAQTPSTPCVSSFPWERFPHALGFLVIPDGCKVPGHQPIAVIRLTRCAALQPPVWSRWISLQGPRGPVSLISQKLSSM